MSIPQLHYFAVRGFGEYIRLLLVDNHIEFEDVRYEQGGEKWKETKPKMIFGHMPCLKIDGKEIVETGAIMRHLGRKYKLNGSTDDDITFLDMFFEGSRDIRFTYADYSLFEELDVYHHWSAGILDKFPVLKEFWERMWKEPNLKEYLEKRTADKVKISATFEGNY